LHRGQAHAVDRDAVAQFDVRQVQLAGFHVHAHIAAAGTQGADTADGFDYACEHEASHVLNNAWICTAENSCLVKNRAHRSKGIMAGKGVAPLWTIPLSLYPDYDRRLRDRTESADPARLSRSGAR